jgi:hypothetical protein
MPRVKLTKSAIDGFPTTTRDVVYWDAGNSGFGVKVTPTGRKVFIVLYRAGGAVHGCVSIRSDPMVGSPCTRLVWRR